MFPAWGHLCFQVRCGIRKAVKMHLELSRSSVNICQILNELSNKKFSLLWGDPLTAYLTTNQPCHNHQSPFSLSPRHCFFLGSQVFPTFWVLAWIWPMGPNQTSNFYGYLRIRLVIKMASPVYYLSSLDSYSQKFRSYVDRNPNIAWWCKRCPQWPMPPGLHALISLSLRVGWT